MTNEPTLKKIFRTNMLIGLIVVVISVYCILTGHYENLQQLAAEGLMNKLAVGGLLYVVGFWYLCVFRKQIFTIRKS